MRYLILLFLTVPCQANRAVMEMIPALNNTVFVSTPNAFIGISTTTPKTTLDVAGNAQFGTTAKSTFSTTGALSLASGASLTVTGGSVTSSGFFGNGAGITGIAEAAESTSTAFTDKSNTFASSQTVNNSMQVNSLRVNLASDDGSGSSLQVGGTGGIDMNNANSKLTIFANNAIQSNAGNSLALGLSGWTSMSITPPLTMLSSVTINGDMRFNGRFDRPATFASSATFGSNGGLGTIFANDSQSGSTDGIFTSSASSNGGGLKMYSDAAGYWLWNMEGSASAHGAGFLSLFNGKTLTYSIVVEPTNGYVSIGNATATNPLHVQGNADVSGSVDIGTQTAQGFLDVEMGNGQKWSLALGNISGVKGPDLLAINAAYNTYQLAYIDAKPLILNAGSGGQVLINTTNQEGGNTTTVIAAKLDSNAALILGSTNTVNSTEQYLTFYPATGRIETGANGGSTVQPLKLGTGDTTRVIIPNGTVATGAALCIDANKHVGTCTAGTFTACTCTAN